MHFIRRFGNYVVKALDLPERWIIVTSAVGARKLQVCRSTPVLKVPSNEAQWGEGLPRLVS